MEQVKQVSEGTAAVLCISQSWELLPAGFCSGICGWQYWWWGLEAARRESPGQELERGLYGVWGSVKLTPLPAWPGARSCYFPFQASEVRVNIKQAPEKNGSCWEQRNSRGKFLLPAGSWALCPPWHFSFWVIPRVSISPETFPLLGVSLPEVLRKWETPRYFCPSVMSTMGQYFLFPVYLISESLFTLVRLGFGICSSIFLWFWRFLLGCQYPGNLLGTCSVKHNTFNHSLILL